MQLAAHLVHIDAQVATREQAQHKAERLGDLAQGGTETAQEAGSKAVSVVAAAWRLRQVAWARLMQPARSQHINGSGTHLAALFWHAAGASTKAGAAELTGSLLKSSPKISALLLANILQASDIRGSAHGGAAPVCTCMHETHAPQRAT